MLQMNELQDMADTGEFPEVPLREETAAQKPAGAVLDAVTKAGEVMQDVAGRAKEVAAHATEAAAAVIDKAGGLLRDTLGKFSSSFGGKSEQEL